MDTEKRNKILMQFLKLEVKKIYSQRKNKQKKTKYKKDFKILNIKKIIKMMVDLEIIE